MIDNVLDPGVEPRDGSGGSDGAAGLLDPELLPVERVGAEICRLAGQIAAATSRFLRLLADFDAREGWAGWNIASCAHWLSWRCGLDLRTAREHVRVARALAELPLIRAAFDAGRISYSKVRAIARVATETSEADLLEAALHAPAAHVERLVRGLRSAQKHDLDPDDLGIKPRPEPAPAKQISWQWDLHTGELILSGRLSPADGARLLAAATRAANELARSESAPTADSGGAGNAARDVGPGADRVAGREHSSSPATPPARQPDGSAEPPLTTRPPSDIGPALLAMAEMVCSNLAAPAHAPAADVLVTVDIATLAEAFADAGSAPEPSQDPTPAKGPVPGRGARLDDGPALAAACLRRLVDDGRLRFATADSDGNLLDLGRASRIPNAAQFRALWRRDHGCSVPGCGRTRFLHAHHVVFWSNGGATTLDNLVLLCSEHHRALHEGAFTITALGGQRFRFTGADGTECQPAPTVHGTADDLVTDHADITPDAIHPNWDGTPLHRDAIGTYLDAWKAVFRRNRAAA